MAHPDATDATRGNKHAALLEFIGCPHLTISRLFNRERDDGLLDFRCDAVFEEGLLPADLLQGEFAARFIEFFETVETISGKAHHLAGLADVTQGLREG